MVQEEFIPISKKLSLFIGSLLFAGLYVGLFAPRILAYAPTLAGLLIGSYLLINYKQTALSFCKRKLLFIVLSFGFAILGAFWAPNTEFSLERVFKAGIIIIPSLVLLSNAHKLTLPSYKTVYYSLFILFILGATFLIFEGITDHGISRSIVGYDVIYAHLNKSFLVFCFLSLLLMAITPIYSKNHKLASITILVLSLITLYYSESQTAQLSFICGLLFLFLFPIKNKNFGKIFLGGLIVLFLSLPFILKPCINMTNNQLSDATMRSGMIQKAATKARFNVWETSIIEIKKKPIFGHGIEAQRFMRSDHLKLYFKDKTRALHAHNIILQIWLEFGLVGILFAITLLAYIFKLIYAEENLRRRKLYMVLFTTSFCCMMTGFGLWQSWQLGMIFLFIALARIMTAQQKSETL